MMDICMAVVFTQAGRLMKYIKVEASLLNTQYTSLVLSLK